MGAIQIQNGGSNNIRSAILNFHYNFMIFLVFKIETDDLSELREYRILIEYKN